MPSSSTNGGEGHPVGSRAAHPPSTTRVDPTEPGSERPGDGSDVASAESATVKQRWRRRILGNRARIPEALRRNEADALAEAWRSAAYGLLRGGTTLCAYVPSRDEPGSLEMLDDARDAGIRVLLPRTGPPGPLDWAEFTGRNALHPARYGIREPDGPPLGAAAVREATAVLVPALAADRRGVRLGRGAGYYDRTLGLTAPGTELVCVLRDDEYVEELPEDRHDVRVTAVLTPARGLVRPDRP